jgi:hypothetical protein
MSLQMSWTNCERYILTHRRLTLGQNIQRETITPDSYPFTGARNEHILAGGETINIRATVVLDTKYHLNELQNDSKLHITDDRFFT